MSLLVSSAPARRPGQRCHSPAASTWPRPWLLRTDPEELGSSHSLSGWLGDRATHLWSETDLPALVPWTLLSSAVSYPGTEDEESTAEGPRAPPTEPGPLGKRGAFIVPGAD